ncbi:MAG: endolytic transglycosylase MltG, partial [Gammaproteobacteria bacterium]|nr:endolytic transglycosylase MltG [Gammaproteobacteria bacterium]
MRHRRTRLALIAAVLVVVAAGTFAVHRVRTALDRPLPIAAPLVYRIAPGSSLARIAADLHRRGVLPAPRWWALYARWRGEAGAVRAGEYELRPGLSARGLLEKLVKGEILLRAFTIV